MDLGGANRCHVSLSRLWKGNWQRAVRKPQNTLGGCEMGRGWIRELVRRLLIRIARRGQIKSIWSRSRIKPRISRCIDQTATLNRIIILVNVYRIVSEIGFKNQLIRVIGHIIIMLHNGRIKGTTIQGQRKDQDTEHTCRNPSHRLPPRGTIALSKHIPLFL